MYSMGSGPEEGQYGCYGVKARPVDIQHRPGPPLPGIPGPQEGL